MHLSPMLFDFQCGLSPVFSLIIHTKMHILLNINQLSSINVAPSGMFSPQSNFAVSDSRTEVFGKVRLFHPDTFCAEFSSNPVFSGICFEHFSGVPRPLSMLCFGTLFSTLLTYVSLGFCSHNILYTSALHTSIGLDAPAKTTFHFYLLALF